MIHVRLSEDEAREVEAAFRSAQDRKYRDRLQVVWLAHNGRKRQDIAADLCIDRRSVQRWINAYCERGLAGLAPKKAPGKTPGIPVSMADEIKRWVIEGPAQQGLDRANWTHEELADHLLKAKGIRTSRSAVQRFCSKIGIRVYRPTYRYLRGDPDHQAKAREDIDALKRGRRPATSSC